MHIFLIRHGESVANAGENYEKRIPDHLVPLTERGKAQARANGKWLKEYCDKNSVDIARARIWRSPFLRTRQTCDEFNKYLGISDIREDITLTEQQFGLFDSVPYEEWEAIYPNEFYEYERQMSNYGKFYARMPLGESPFDVAIRIHQFMGTIYRDYEKHGVDTLFVFTHGTTLRTFLLRWFHYSPEWYHEERNPKNCMIREIINNKDMGYINADEVKRTEQGEKAVFLDIDGVLNSYKYDRERGEEGNIDKSRLPLIKQLTYATNAKIVLTSSWRKHWSTCPEERDEIGEEIDNTFAEAGLTIYGKTPDIGDRAIEISEWLKENPNFTRFVILDDMFGSWGDYDDYLVKTNYRIGRGLGEEHIKAALDILGTK